MKVDDTRATSLPFSPSFPLYFSHTHTKTRTQKHTLPIGVRSQVDTGNVAIPLRNFKRHVLPACVQVHV